MRETLELQKKAFIENGQPTYNQRVDSLKRCIALLETHDVQIVEALNEDYKNRSETEIMTSEVIQSIRNLNFTIKNLKKWMKPSRRPSSFMADLLGSKALMQPSPLGTVGIIAPWNFPIGMVFYPTASILAAGNRIMVKPSEFTPNTASLIKEAVGKYFDESEGIKILFFLLHPVSIGLKAIKPNLDNSFINLTPMYVLPTSVFVPVINICLLICEHSKYI